MAFILLIFLRLFFLLITQGSQFTSHNITLGSSLSPYSNPAWVSASGLFAFGFYQEDNGFRVGIWLATKPEIIVVWTANRDDPLVSSNSTINLITNGWLLLHTNGEDKNITTQRVPATSASMHDSGNFLLYDDSGVAIWESFEHPCDTVLGGQELATYDHLVSSVSPSHHMSGNFVLNLQNNGNLVAYPLYAGSRLDDDSYWSTKTSDLGGYVSMYLNHTGSLNMVKDGVTQRVLNPVILSSGSRKRNEIVIFRATLRWDGNFVLYSHRFISNSTRMIMKKEWEALHDPCEAKGICGSNSYCVSNGGNFSCHCFPGFLAFNETRNGNFYSCYRNFTDEEACNGKREGLKLSYNITSLENIKLRDHYSYSVMNLSKEACRQSCLDDCNCWASLHANAFSCKMLKVPIIYAVRNKSILSTVFIKTSFPYDPPEYPLRNETKKLVYILAITLGCLAFMCTIMAFFSFFFYRVHAHNSFESISGNTDHLEVFRDQFRLRAFSYDDLHKATDGFKEMIGRNSYKGFISEGKKAVIVKRLERLFEGEGWFREEITAIAQTHHRNLVGLLGFCIQGSTKLLVYEFMINGSLEDLLFNAETPPGWEERVRVTLDVARGILYLHEECEAPIIHCNITPRNILFDEFWTAKISDFGLSSKLWRSNQRGSKVDIYSFGVVLLKILCCRNDMEIDVLTTWVYNCFVNKDWNRLIEDDEVDVWMLEKMVKVGLLCIQNEPDSRPSIKNVILMLEGTTDIPIPPSPTPPLI
ncbi:G-type lectin S-receptor-like serine/threonine-protein kinase LECRK2 [Lactuca sativa]|uniref:G-type lectin S-receptor-like serine/threonine-protein kinase LECRK2 n=1 Tax=Lactuca sativa TaxID=4236 RepID=UPI000CBB86BA|nr:G-type lectin S-receptor-like serine/threonine-protein kinase LECRK2 [Lactuca sativa]